ncbi:uncharacterized protein B0T15DRAFT_492657 [Chaetomium strumarium]|uniref:Zn(2)-C6 fungal-type domain-containing protein n=1 Tax=Chaetomium strumarium TaxID=1170767 RepID=A0AAJ0M3A4_9PEZI|nr:hypothetical protein B0T15DRAFT_492657 [Chaetomium strumarium]
MRDPVKRRDACDRCAQSKVKCNRGQPSCKRCLHRGVDCHYSPCRRLGRPGTGTVPLPSPPTSGPQLSEPPERKATAVKSFSFRDQNTVAHLTLAVDTDNLFPTSFDSPVEPLWQQPFDTPVLWDVPMHDPGWSTPGDSSPTTSTTAVTASSSASFSCDTSASVSWQASSSSYTSCAAVALSALRSISHARSSTSIASSCNCQGGGHTTTISPNGSASLGMTSTSTSASPALPYYLSAAAAMRQAHAILDCACAASDGAVAVLLLLICAEAVHSYRRFSRGLFTSTTSTPPTTDDSRRDAASDAHESILPAVTIGGHTPPAGGQTNRTMIAGFLLGELAEVGRGLARLQRTWDHHLLTAEAAAAVGMSVSSGGGGGGGGGGCYASPEEGILDDATPTARLTAQVRGTMVALRNELWGIVNCTDP